MGDLSRSGVVGDAREASAALGEALFEQLVQSWCQRLESLLVSDWPPMGAALALQPTQPG
jgi:creatinine amidohydrolase